MNEARYVAAIEISSSKIVAIVGKAHADGQLEIIASEQEKGVESVRYGIIKNLEETSSRIMRILNKLERWPNVAPRRFVGIFVGLAGRSMRSIPAHASLALPDETEITDEIIKRLLSQVQTTAIDASLKVVDAVPRIFKVDRTETISPKGTVGSNISAEYDLIVCRPEIERMIVRTVEDKIGLKINGIVVSALATGQLILTAEEKRLGCMLVDIGAETTSVTIYKNGHLVYFATLPLGGRNITRDITSLNLLEERAETLKITSGNAIPREAVSTRNYNGVRDVDISNLIVARSEEIVVNILRQIKYAELKDNDLPGGIICIGGGSKLNGMLELIANKSGLNVRRGALPDYIMIQDPKINPADIIEVASVLYAGAMVNMSPCMEIPKVHEPKPEVVEEPVEEIPRRTKRGGWLNKFRTALTGQVSNLFAGNEDDSDVLD